MMKFPIYGKIEAMFQTTNQVADFPLIKNPVETTDVHAEIRKFDGGNPLMLRVWPNRCFYTKKTHGS